jgi:ribosomal protein S18 acetylase RimI-like enzyme
MTARIRKFEVGDVEQVLALAQRYASWDATPTKADIEGFHSASPEFFLVAEAEGKVIGFVYGRESNPPAEVLDKWNSRKVASIEMLAVDADCRQQGIATSLLVTLFESFRQKEIDLVTLSVPAVEIAAVNLYAKLGFEPRAQFLWKRLTT